MKKNILTIILCAAALSLTACGNNDSTQNSQESQTPQNSQNSSQVSQASQASQSSQDSQASQISQTVSDTSSAPSESTAVSAGAESAAPSESSEQQDSSAVYYSYEREDDGIEILGGGDPHAEEVEIPAEFNGQKVVGISGSAKKSLFTEAKKITLPNTLRDIDNYAFAGCTQLTEINIP